MPAPKDPEKYEEWRRKLREAKKDWVPWNKGRKISMEPQFDEYRKKIGDASRGKSHPGKPMSEETKKKQSERMKGKKWGFANGWKHSEESKKKMSASHKGVPTGPVSEEQKKQISLTLKKRYADNPGLGKELASRRDYSKGKEKRQESLKKFWASERGEARRKELKAIKKPYKPLSEKHKQAISKGNKIYFNQPEIKEELSKRTKELNLNPEYKENVKRAFAREDVKKKMSDAAKSLWASEEYRTNASNTTGELWKTETYRERVTKAISKNAKERWSDPEKREALMKFMRDPESRKRKSASARILWDKPEHRKQAIEKLLERNKTITKKYKTGFYDSPKAGLIFHRSGYELIAYTILDNDENVVTYEAEPMEIPYEFEGVTHSYYPDILVTYKDNSEKVIEVKPKYMLSDPQTQAKHSAAFLLLGSKFEIWSEDELTNLI